MDPANCFENYIGWTIVESLGYASRLLPFVKYGGSACNSLVLIQSEGLDLARHQRRFPAPQSIGELLGFDPTFNRCFDLPFQFLAQDKDLPQVFCNRRSKQSRLTTYSGRCATGWHHHMKSMNPLPAVLLSAILVSVVE